MPIEKPGLSKNACVNCLVAHQGLWEAGGCVIQMLVSGSVPFKKRRSWISILEDEFCHFTIVECNVGRGRKGENRGGCILRENMGERVK